MLENLIAQCFGEPKLAIREAEAQIANWQDWLLPIHQDRPVGHDPNYEDAFQLLREEVNKISGADTALILTYCQKLLTEQSKDVRVATYYIWARLHQDGEKGLAEGLSLLAGLVAKFGEQLLPQRPATRLAAIEWLSSTKMLSSLLLYPEVEKQDFCRVVASLYYLDQQFNSWQEETRPQLNGLVSAIGNRLLQAGGLDATVPQTARETSHFGQNFTQNSHSSNSAVPEINTIQSGRDLLEQSKALASYLKKQPNGWLASARLMRVMRWDTVHLLPATDNLERTKLQPPRQELRQKLKRLYLNQNWAELLEQVEITFAQGVNHFWLDLQWYSAKAIQNLDSPYTDWLNILTNDLVNLLDRLPTLETFAFQDGTPFADDVTRAWITHLTEPNSVNLANHSLSTNEVDDILALESEAIHLADTENIDAALRWISNIPNVANARDRFLQQLLMARVAEQYGKHEMSIHLLYQLLGTQAIESEPTCLLAEWEPDLLFEVYARLLKLLRNKHVRDTDKSLYQKRADPLLAALIRIDPVRASVLCN